MAIYAKGIGICDTNIQSGYNLTNVDLTLVWNGGAQTTSSSNDSAWLVPEGNTTCTITASKSHYAQSGTYYGRLGYAYTCPECGGEVTTIDSECPVCGEPVVSGSALTPVLAVSGGTNDGWKTESQGGKILLTRTNDNKAMTQEQLKDTLSGMGFTSAYLNSPTKVTSNTSAFKTNVSNNLTNYPVTIYEGTYADNKAYLHKNSFIPQTVPFSEPYYIRVVSGKTHNITSSAQTINSIVKTNISDSAITITSNKSWINNIHKYEDKHGDFSLITISANVDENDSFTDDRSGVITLDSGSYGITKTIPVTQSAKTGYSEYNITFYDNLDGGEVDANDFVRIYGSNGSTLLSHYTASQYFGTSSLSLQNVPTSAMTPVGEQPNLIMEFDLSETISKGNSVIISSTDSEEGELNLDVGQTSGTLSFKNLLGTITNQIHIDTGTFVSEPK
jgi:hypothetical protein